MRELSPKQRIKVLEMVTKIATEAAGNTNVVLMIEFQEELIERLYNKMRDLLLEGEEHDADEPEGGYQYRYED